MQSGSSLDGRSLDVTTLNVSSSFHVGTICLQSQMTHGKQIRSIELLHGRVAWPAFLCTCILPSILLCKQQVSQTQQLVVNIAIAPSTGTCKGLPELQTVRTILVNICHCAFLLCLHLMSAHETSIVMSQFEVLPVYAKVSVLYRC